jgi:hypothetical protein
MRSVAKYPLAESLFDLHKMVLPFSAFRHLHLDELISLKSVAEASPTLIRCVTNSLRRNLIEFACLLSQDNVGLSLVNIFHHFL